MVPLTPVLSQAWRTSKKKGHCVFATKDCDDKLPTNLRGLLATNKKAVLSHSVNSCPDHESNETNAFGTLPTFGTRHSCVSVSWCLADISCRKISPQHSCHAPPPHNHLIVTLLRYNNPHALLLCFLTCASRLNVARVMLAFVCNTWAHESMMSNISLFSMRGAARRLLTALNMGCDAPSDTGCGFKIFTCISTRPLVPLVSSPAVFCSRGRHASPSHDPSSRKRFQRVQAPILPPPNTPDP